MRQLDLVYVLDPFDPATRSELQGLPASHGGGTLADGDLRQALLADALFIARNVRPAYLVIGHEVNVVFERNPEAYTEFVSIYSETYDAVKEAVPENRGADEFPVRGAAGRDPVAAAAHGALGVAR